jgi:hypothetical protein
MNKRLQPAQSQQRQPGRESEMRPLPEYRNILVADGSKARSR